MNRRAKSRRRPVDRCRDRDQKIRNGRASLTPVVDAVKIAVNVASGIHGSAVPDRPSRGAMTVSGEARKFGLFRNALKTSVHPGGTTIFQEGDQGQSMFAIKRGRVAILVGGTTVDTLNEEEIFGEMALLEHAARTATAVTLEETELVEIDEAQFYIFVRQNPHFALQLMQLLSERLRRADALYRKSQAK
jgi:CRP/FNR family transcriptional regulator, cyclic AMP receptor protein